MSEESVRTLCQSFLKLLNGISAKYSLSGLIDLSEGTGMSHMGLCCVFEKINECLPTNNVSTDDDALELLGCYDVLLRQILHNVRTYDDELVQGHLERVLAALGSGYIPEPIEERNIDLDRFAKDDILAIIHSAIL